MKTREPSPSVRQEEDRVPPRTLSTAIVMIIGFAAVLVLVTWRIQVAPSSITSSLMCFGITATSCSSS